MQTTLFEPTEAADAPKVPVGQYDPQLARERRDEGMANAELGAMAHIGDDWPLRAYRAVKIVAETHQTFIVDEVWQHVEEPAEPRAMGAVMKRAVAEGLIERTERFQKSARVTAHCNERRVWRSLVYRGDR